MRHATIAACILFAIACTRAGGEQSAQIGATDANSMGRFNGMSYLQLRAEQPKLEGYKEYPPRTAKGVEMWQWWRAMRKVEPKFEHKTPIAFYGLVLDQDDKPVANAVAFAECSVIGGAAFTNVTTDTDGRFSITGLVGKGITTRITKTGFRQVPLSQGSFEYAAFFEPNFHIPDSAKPVVFRLWRYKNPEPMFFWTPRLTVSVAGETNWVDVCHGEFGKTGQVGVSVARDHTPREGTEAGYTVRIVAEEGGGLVATEDDPMFTPPESGYAPALTINEPASTGPSDVKHRVGLTVRCYLRTRDGKYGALEFRIAQFLGPEAGVQTLLYFNPSGSRNLEYDDKLRLRD